MKDVKEYRRRADELERENEALRAQVAAVEALADGPNQPGRWVLPEDDDEPAVWVSDLRAALATTGEGQR